MAKVGHPIKFGIRLTPEERTRLEWMIHCGKGAINSALKARILLKADVSENGPVWSDERIAEALETSLSTVFRTVASLSKKGWMPHCHARRVLGHHLGFLTERQRSG